MPLRFEEVMQAYFDCRRHKRNTLYALGFEFELERNLFQLFEELTEGRYQIGRGVAFVVEQPKMREIWAAMFRDRVVHHVIYNRLYPRTVQRADRFREILPDPRAFPLQCNEKPPCPSKSKNCTSP